MPPDPRDKEMDLDRKYIDVDGRLLFGKYRDESVFEVRPGYLAWMIVDVDLDYEEMQQVLRALVPQVMHLSQWEREQLVASPRYQAALKARKDKSAPIAPADEAAQRFTNIEVDATAENENAVAIVPVPATQPFKWTDEQEKAISAILKWAVGARLVDGRRAQTPAPMMTLSGYAGTGKTTTIRALLSQLPVRPFLTAMTGKAALRLTQLTGQQATTLHSILYFAPGESQGASGQAVLEFTSRKPPPGPIVIVDECSLVTPKIYADLQEWAYQGVRILFVGDSFQLPPILTKDEEEAYGADFMIFREVDGPKLTQVVRSSGPVLDAATHLRTARRVQMQSQAPYKFERVRDSLAQAIADYALDPEDHVLITWRNVRRMAANRAVRTMIGRKGAWPEHGEPVMIRQNASTYVNGTIVLVDGWTEGLTIGGQGDKPGTETIWLHIQDGPPILVFKKGREEFLDGGRPFIDDWWAWRHFCEDPLRDLPVPVPITWGYVLTANIAQGSEWRRTTVFLADADTRASNFRKATVLPDGPAAPFSIRFLYSALTRAREEATIYIGTEG